MKALLSNMKALLSKRNITIQERTPNRIRLTFKSSDIHKARWALNTMIQHGGFTTFEDVNGGKAVGGFYASASWDKDAWYDLKESLTTPEEKLKEFTRTWTGKRVRVVK